MSDPKTIADLHFDPKNARRRTERSYGMLQRSLEEVGAARSIVIDEDGVILAGNGTVEAAGQVGIERVKVVDVDGDTIVAVRRRGLTEEQKVRLALLDNRTADLTEWDAEALARLQVEGADLSDLWREDELQAMMDAAVVAGDGAGGEAPEAEVDRAEELREKWGTATGQLWQIGRHRLLCGDCRRAEDVVRLLGGERINVCVTSPPYASQRRYDEESEFRPIRPDDYGDWFEAVQRLIAEHLAPDGSFFLNIKEHCEDGQRHLYVKDLTIRHVREWGWRFVDELCWQKPGMPGHPLKMGYRFKNGWEPVFHFATGREPKMRPDSVAVESDAVFAYDANVTTGNLATYQGHDSPKFKTGRGKAFPSNVLTAAGVDVKAHEAVFPVGLPAFFIKAFSDPGDVVYEPFCGSGTTLVAAEQENRRGYGIEISPKYVAVTLERLSLMGLDPKLIGSPHESAITP